MTINDDRDLVGLTRVARVVAEARRAMLAAVAPGVTTADLDAVGREVLDRHAARPAPPTVGFPAATCVSVNDEAAHGIPSGRVLLAGDVVNVDVSAELDGYWADTGASRPVGEGTSRIRELVEGARQANADAVQAARAGRPVRDIGRAAQRCAHRRRLSVLRNLSGHGTGRALWEEPTVSGFDDPSARATLHEGLVIAVEPFVSTGARWAQQADDGWTLVTPGHLSAQFEHTIVVTHGEPLVLTAD